MDTNSDASYIYDMEKTDPLITVQISVYAFDGAGLNRDTGTISTVAWGEAAAVWPALQSAYESVAAKYKVIVNTVMCNASPLPARASGRR